MSSAVAEAPVIVVTPFFLHAGWRCLCCGTLQTIPQAGLFWNGPVLYGFVCYDHTPFELDECRTRCQARPAPQKD